MLSIEEFEKLEGRIKTGKAWIESNGGWAGNGRVPFDARRFTPRNKLERSIVLWFQLSDKREEELASKSSINKTKSQPHSKAWNLMKQNEALDKWKHTLKAKRGQDPRTIPLESFI